VSLREAVSPLVAVLLLVAITVAAALASYFFVLRISSTLQTSARSPLAVIEERVRIVGVERASCPPDNCYRVHVVNYGDVRVCIDRVYVVSRGGLTVYVYDPGNWCIDPGEELWWWLWVPGGVLVEGREYVVLLTTTRGSEARCGFRA